VKVIPDKFFPPGTEKLKERFERLGGALFRADPETVKARLKAEEGEREKANGGAKPRKRGRPKRGDPESPLRNDRRNDSLS
jgi:hypothetical protein